METQTKKNKVVVIITRYNEYIDWIKYIIENVDFIYIYNKGTNNNFFTHFDITGSNYVNKVKFVNLPNIGRIDHTLVYHILENWENLPDILINLPGSIMMCKRKGHYLASIMKRIHNLKSKYLGFYGPRFVKVSPSFNYFIDNYEAEGICNRNGNKFIKSEYSNFQEWKKAIIDERPMHYISLRGMFAICKENITYINKTIYTNLLKSLSVGDNIENGHFAERIWAHLFRQYSFDSNQNQVFNTNQNQVFNTNQNQVFNTNQNQVFNTNQNQVFEPNECIMSSQQCDTQQTELVSEQ